MSHIYSSGLVLIRLSFYVSLMSGIHNILSILIIIVFSLKLTIVNLHKGSRSENNSLVVIYPPVNIEIAASG